MFYETNRHSKIRRTSFHEMISTARDKNLPAKLAWGAAVITCVSMSLIHYVNVGTPEIVPCIILFFIYALLFQGLSRIIFFILFQATNRVYTKHIQDDGNDSYTDRLGKKDDSSYNKTGVEKSDTLYAWAKATLGINGPYTMDQLKKSRNVLLTKGKAHPDNGGSSADCEAVLQAYHILAKYIK